jgi:ribosomal protein S18 acetylase RimI-like enzyme
MTIQILTQKAEMLPLYPIFQQLNPKVSQARYDRLLDDMLPFGYRMVAVFEGEECLGLSGIWVATKFYSGKYLEMDNVVVAAEHRSKGIGNIMYDFIEQLAIEEGVETIMLDAYRENEKGHAFYKRLGFVPRGLHFIKPIGEWPKANFSPLPERFF